MKWMDFGRETPFLAEMPETRQHFFVFSPVFYFYPVVVSPWRTTAQVDEGAPFS